MCKTSGSSAPSGLVGDWDTVSENQCYKAFSPNSILTLWPADINNPMGPTVWDNIYYNHCFSHSYPENLPARHFKDYLNETNVGECYGFDQYTEINLQI